MLTALVTYAAEEGAAKNPLIPAWYDIIWSGVCFIVILVLFWLYALPRMKKLLDERSAAIEGNIAKADEAQRKAEAALEEYTAQLADARREAGEIRDAAREDGKKILAEAKENASAEAARLTAAAHA
ncbi:F0F1 ATP synthase subunit B, partial [Microbacterium schleiferi]|uniref:F0F1 ATP synthase subunit B family protein n=2 Tax=Microbacterium TaxID=33882 RepID=UPI0035C7FF52